MNMLEAPDLHDVSSHGNILFSMKQEVLISSENIVHILMLFLCCGHCATTWQQEVILIWLSHAYGVSWKVLPWQCVICQETGSCKNLVSTQINANQSSVMFWYVTWCGNIFIGIHTSPTLISMILIQLRISRFLFWPLTLRLSSRWKQLERSTCWLFFSIQRPVIWLSHHTHLTSELPGLIRRVSPSQQTVPPTSFVEYLSTQLTVVSSALRNVKTISKV